MSEKEDIKIAELEGELAACQELLFGVLMTIVEPVEIDVPELREMLKGRDHMIDATLDTDRDVVTCRILEIKDNDGQS